MGRRTTWLTEEGVAASLGISLESSRDWVSRGGWKSRWTYPAQGQRVRVFGVPNLPVQAAVEVPPALASLGDGSLLAEVRALRASLDVILAALPTPVPAPPRAERRPPSSSSFSSVASAPRSRLRDLHVLDGCCSPAA